MAPPTIESQLLRHKDAIYRQMMRVCRQREDAEDALGTAMLLALKSSEQLRDDGNFRAWLGTIARRVCGRMSRNAVLEQLWSDSLEDGVADSRSNETEMALMKSCVQGALGKLSEPYRRVYELCEIEERSVAEAANDLGISTAAAKSRLLRARQRVREELDASICGG